MEVIESLDEIHQRCTAARIAGQRVVLVPTMGALHEGHLSLMEIGREHGDIVVASIFVNPTQFSPSEDFGRYPRAREEDLEKCEAHGVDIVFAPAEGSLYPADYSTYVIEESLSTGLCGVSRPVFFKGVATVVAKLFNLVQPHVAVFGQKDAQQAAVIRRMVRDLHFPVEIIVGPTVRDTDGLALSSRNRYLNSYQRADALALPEALKIAQEMVDKGVTNVDRLRAEITHHLGGIRRLRLIYVTVVHKDTIEELRSVVPGKTLIAVAVWCDEVRLIDNLIV